MMWLATKKCLFCKHIANEPHHIRAGLTGGMGLKPKDWFIIPTCSDCHREIHSKGEVSFYERNGFTIEKVKNKARRLYDGRNS
jgi:hypothetical protein